MPDISQIMGNDLIAKSSNSLIQSVKTLEQTPYQLRQTPITANRTLEKLIGVSCAFNQLLDISNYLSTGGSVSTVDGVGTFIANGANQQIYRTVTTIVNHVTLGIISFKTTTATSDVCARMFGYDIPSAATTSWQTAYKMFKSASSSGASIGIKDMRSSDWDSIQTKDIMFIDLTACFGSEVADYFYNLEQNTAGSGVALFRQLFPEDYYAYQTATLISSKPVSKVIKDSDNNVIAAYPLGSDEIRGLLKVENGQLVAYGDIHPSDGNGTEVFISQDLGDLEWSYITSGSVPRFQASLTTNAKTLLDNTKIANAISDIFAVNSWANVTNVATYDDTLALNAGGTVITIHDSSYTDAATFKTAMSGKYLIYEKATPTAKSYTPFTNPMLCGSTEEFTDSRSLKMFCGHDSLYYTETEGDKLANLPEVTGEQGDFIINNADGKMTLKKRNAYSEIGQIVGTWIDGKPIYEKTLTGTFGAENDTIAMSTGYGVLAIISAAGFIISDDLTSSKLIDGGDGSVFFYGVTEDGVLVKRDSTSTCGSTPTAYVTVRYIKS